MTLDALTLNTFSGFVGETFRMHAGSADPLAVTLTEAKSLGDPPEEGMREPFSLVFLGPLEPLCSQGTYVLEHDAAGKHELFLVPIGPNRDGQGMRYEAVFS